MGESNFFASFDEGARDFQKKLLEVEKEKEAIFEESSDAIFVLNSDSGEIVDANSKAAAVTGYPLSQLRGMNFVQLVPDREIFLTPTECHLSSESGASRVILKRQDGAMICVEFSSCCIQREQKSLRFVFVRSRGRDALSRLLPVRHANHQDRAGTSGDALEPIHEFPNIIGKSAEIRKICQLIGQIAKTDCTVLIQGESGTGKEIVAQAIHFHSSRSHGPFVKVNCAALSETLLESELFGHVKGAFTGAIRDHVGRFKQADGGAILLDEINCMSLSGQAKFLRVLQERELEPVGSSQTMTVDVRVIVASNTNLETAVTEGKFREDLYYRLNVFPIFIPPLRERKEDIPLLVQHFLKKYNLAIGKEIRDFAPETLALMMKYDWPGNVRELENAVEHAVIVGKGAVVLPGHLPSNLTFSGAEKVNKSFSEQLSLRDQLNLHEKQIIIEALTRAHGVKKQAAEMLQIDPRNFPYLLRKHNLFYNGSSKTTIKDEDKRS